jgi:hypothetical protein
MEYLLVYTRIAVMATRRLLKRRAKRNGKPLVVYFSEDQAARLDSVSQERRVAKADLVRLAVDRLLNQLGSGQLDLPLGV